MTRLEQIKERAEKATKEDVLWLIRRLKISSGIISSQTMELTVANDLLDKLQKEIDDAPVVHYVPFGPHGKMVWLQGSGEWADPTHKAKLVEIEELHDDT